MKLKVIYKIFLMAPLMGLALAPAAAQELKGKVTEWDEGMNMEMPIAGANIFWLDNSSGTVSDNEGNFTLRVPSALPASLVVSYVGYRNDTAVVHDLSFKKIMMKKAAELDAVIVEGKENTLGISTLKTINTETITEKELLKAACCNLSESFETNPTVTVAYRDAVTGAKEIQLLGLSGIYSQLLTENIPNMNGLARIYGLTYIPGPWLESIQIAKGAGSVTNGYESTTGLINVEFKKPDETETPKFYLNLYGAESTNTEVNSFLKTKVNDAWSTIMMVHGNYFEKDIDRNADGFKDMPHSKQANVYNRWEYRGDRLEGQIGLKYIYDDLHGGQVHPGGDNDVNPAQYYVTSVLTHRAEAFAKLGILFPFHPDKSIGNTLQYTWHDMDGTFGLRDFNGTEKSLYYQSIYQNSFSDPSHSYKLGWTYKYDRYRQVFNGTDQTMTQSVPGVFVEYKYTYFDKFTAIVGVREDYHNEYKWVFTPRLHLKYGFTDNLVVRGSAGKSFRVPYAIAENISLLSSAKQLVFAETIRPEEAWNYGVNLTQRFRMAEREASINVDVYRTDFINQLIVDQYSSPDKVSFYNLDGKSYANSLQATFSYELIKRLDLRLAYKKDDVKETFNGTLEQKPLVPSDRALANVAYATPDKWKFDYTVVWNGKQRLANAAVDDIYGRLPDRSPDYTTMNLQVTKVFKHIEIYTGVENLTDFRQPHPIINANNPFSNTFDATQVWGPVEGRRIYAGVRYSIE